MKLKLLTMSILMSGSGFMSEAVANCTPLDNSFSTTSVTMNNITVTVRPNQPNGHIINHVHNFSASPNTTYKCSGTTKITSELTQLRPLSPPNNDSKLYATNIPGIAMRLQYENRGNNSKTNYWPVDNVSQLYDINLKAGDGTFTLAFYKTGNITKSGNITSGLYARRYINGLFNKPIYLVYINANLRILGYPTCKIQNGADKNIILNTVKSSEFKGVGTTVAEKAFNLDLLCSGSGGVGSDNITADPVSVKFDFGSGSTAGSEYLPNIATANIRAQGVNTQLLHSYKATNVIVKNGSILKLGSVGSNQNNISFKIPMKARYIQTAKTVTAGKVQGRATVTIQYS